MPCLSCGLDSNTVLACEQCGSQLGFPHQGLGYCLPKLEDMRDGQLDPQERDRRLLKLAKVHGDQGLRLLRGVIPE